MLTEMFDYKRWADQRALDAISRIDENQFPSAVAFTRQQLNHMIRVEELFRARLLAADAPHQSTNTCIVPEIEELSSRIFDSNQWYANYVERLDPRHLIQTVSFDFVDGKPGSMTRQEILFHIINHGTYHRGAIGHALDLANVAHPADTYTVFIHSVDPTRREQS